MHRVCISVRWCRCAQPSFFCLTLPSLEAVDSLAVVECRAFKHVERTMRKIAKETGFAVVAWGIPLVISICVYRLKQSSEPLFNAIMGIALTGTIVALGLCYLRMSKGRPIAQGIKIGLLWMVA